MTIHGAKPRSGYKQQPRRIPRSLGFARYTLSFDGVDDYVDCGNDASLILTGSPNITAEAWIKINNYANYNIVYMYGVRATSQMFQLFTRINTGTLALALFANDNNSGVRVITGVWHHIAATLTGTTSKLYLNSLLVSTKTDHLTPNIQPGNAFIGNDNVLSPLHAFNGLIDEVRIYNRVLSAEEIKWNMLNYHNPIRSGLVLWLPMEEGAGEIVYDKSGKENHGTLLPAGTGPTWQRLRQWELRAAVE